MLLLPGIFKWKIDLNMSSKSRKICLRFGNECSKFSLSFVIQTDAIISTFSFINKKYHGSIQNSNAES